MPPIACHEPRCTTKIAPKQKHVELTLPDEPTAHFCSLTCCWSWFQAHVGQKAQAAATDMTPVATPIPPRRHEAPKPSHVPEKKPRQTPAKVTQPIETYAPGTFNWETIPIIPDEGVKRDIAAILRASIEGPHRFAWYALVPYVRVGPSQADTPITVKASERLHLMAAQERTLQGLQDTMDLAIEFDGLNGPVHLRDVLTMPGKQLLAKTALDQAESISATSLDQAERQQLK